MFLNFATNEKDGKEMAVYQSLKDGRVWVKPSDEIFC